MYIIYNIEGDYSTNWKTKKHKQKFITKPIKKCCKKITKRSIIEIFLKMRELKYKIMITAKIKIC